MTSELKLACFDMDGTIIDGRLVEVISKKFGLYDQIKQIQNDSTIFGYIKTQKIASILKGIDEKELEIAIDSISLNEKLPECYKFVKEK